MQVNTRIFKSLQLRFQRFSRQFLAYYLDFPILDNILQATKLSSVANSEDTYSWAGLPNRMSLL
jgi:hypothetical protein